MKKKELLFIIVFSLLIINVSASVDILKPAMANENYTVLQTCASCSFVYTTISNVNGIIASNKPMTNNGSGVWTYDITPTVISRHDVNGIGDLDGTNTSFTTFFDVTPSGKVTSTGDSILYFLFSIVIFGALFAISFFIVAMPSENEKDEGGFDKKIVKLKYFRMVLIFLLWPLIILLLNFLNGLAVNFTALSIFSGILGFLFETMLRLSWPFTVIIIAWIIVMLVHDTNVKKQLKKFENFKPFN